MAVTKTTWEELLKENNGLVSFITSDMTTKATEIDTLFETKYGVETDLSSALTSVDLDYFKLSTSESARGLWKDLPIYMSSYKLKDKRCAKNLADKLIRYLTFFYKMINDVGLQRRLVTSKEYTHNNTSDSGDKNLYSETPQIELDNFEDAIKYASNLSKSDLHNESEQTGDSTENVTSTSWEEGLKNLRFAFYNDLIDYINSLPNIAYSYFSLDSSPAIEIVKAQREYLKTIYKL